MTPRPDRAHVFERDPMDFSDSVTLRLWLCKCGMFGHDPIHVRARDVPREEEIEFGYPRPCETCRATIHRSADHMHLNWMHGDRVGEGPIDFCSIGCLAIYANHYNDMEAVRAG